MNRLQQWLSRFFYGRYGTDHLNRFLLWTSLALFLLDLVFRIFDVTFFVFLRYLAIFCYLYTLFRMLSRNILRRRKENAVFQQIWSRSGKPVIVWFRLQKSKFRDRKTHIYVPCPHCKKTLRLPKQSGDHTVNCPCCRASFSICVK